MAELLRFAVDVRLELTKLGSTAPRDVSRADKALQKWLVDICEEHVDEQRRATRAVEQLQAVRAAGQLRREMLLAWFSTRLRALGPPVTSPGHECAFDDVSLVHTDKAGPTTPSACPPLSASELERVCRQEKTSEWNVVDRMFEGGWQRLPVTHVVVSMALAILQGVRTVPVALIGDEQSFQGGTESERIQEEQTVKYKVLQRVTVSEGSQRDSSPVGYLAPGTVIEALEERAGDCASGARVHCSKGWLDAVAPDGSAILQEVESCGYWTVNIFASEQNVASELVMEAQVLGSGAVAPPAVEPDVEPTEPSGHKSESVWHCNPPLYVRRTSSTELRSLRGVPPLGNWQCGKPVQQGGTGESTSTLPSFLPVPRIQLLKASSAARWMDRLRVAAPALAEPLHGGGPSHAGGTAVLRLSDAGDTRVNGYYTPRHYFEDGPVAVDESNMPKRSERVFAFARRFDDGGALLPKPSDNDIKTESIGVTHATIEYQYMVKHRDVSARSWMERTDGFQGFRRLHHFPNVALAVSKSVKLDLDKVCSAPAGWHWATRAEFDLELNHPRLNDPPFRKRGCRLELARRLKSEPITYYKDQAGWDGCIWAGQERLAFVFADSMLPRRGYVLSCALEGDVADDSDTTVPHGKEDPHYLWTEPRHFSLRAELPRGKFAGLVCIKDSPVPSPGLKWIERTDGFHGFRVLYHFPNLALAVAKHNVLEPDKKYEAPPGWHWASKQETTQIMRGCVARPGKRDVWGGHTFYPYYKDFGGWDGIHWGGHERTAFIFSDSRVNGAFLHAAHQEGRIDTSKRTGAVLVSELSTCTHVTDSAGHTISFAGIVCIRDDILTDSPDGAAVGAKIANQDLQPDTQSADLVPYLLGLAENLASAAPTGR